MKAKLEITHLIQQDVDGISVVITKANGVSIAHSYIHTDNFDLPTISMSRIKRAAGSMLLAGNRMLDDLTCIMPDISRADQLLEECLTLAKLLNDPEITTTKALEIASSIETAVDSIYSEWKLTVTLNNEAMAYEHDKRQIKLPLDSEEFDYE